MNDPALQGEQDDFFYELLGLRPVLLDKRIIDMTGQDLWECQNYQELVTMAKELGKITATHVMWLMRGYK